MTSLRRRLVNVRTALKRPLKEHGQFHQQKDHQRLSNMCISTLEAIEHDIGVVDQHMQTIVGKDERLHQLMELVTSVPSIGTLTGLQIIICTNEFKSIRDPKKFACYAGVAPFINESGKYKGKAKLSNIANKRMKALLHLSALCAIRNIPEIKAYFERRTKIDNKPRMSVVNAIRYKIILRIFACVNQNRMYEKVYDRNSRNVQDAVN
ncbi:transposase [Mucilaginibacter sp. AW1-3]